MALDFRIKNRIPQALGRTGFITTKTGVIKTPAFAVVGTKGTVKGILPEYLKDAGAQVVLANTYHLLLQPGEEAVAASGGIGPFTRWDGPTITDSGGFQAFSLGAAFNRTISKMAKEPAEENEDSVSEGKNEQRGQLVKIDEEGVDFRSHIDGSLHRLTPERSIEIQHTLGADIMFAFDECTSPQAPHAYQREAMERTHRWARRSLARHIQLKGNQSLFGIVQGGRFEDLRKESARTLGALKVDGKGFDGFGIGGSFDKNDMNTAVRWVNEILPEEKPRHLLGIGEPEDLFEGVENGCDLFDCVAPTRTGRNGTLYTKKGKINITNAEFISDEDPIEETCTCYVCTRYDRRYIAHLFRAKEMLGPILGSLHNISFILALMEDIRESIDRGDFPRFKTEFLSHYVSR